MAIRKAIQPEPKPKKMRIVKKKDGRTMIEDVYEDAPPSFSEPIIAFLKRNPIRYHKDK